MTLLIEASIILYDIHRVLFRGMVDLRKYFFLWEDIQEDRV